MNKIYITEDQLDSLIAGVGYLQETPLSPVAIAHLTLMKEVLENVKTQGSKK